MQEPDNIITGHPRCAITWQIPWDLHLHGSLSKPFLFLLDRIKKLLSGWMDKLVSWAGREVLIETVAQAFLTYVNEHLQTNKRDLSFNPSFIICFWWGHKQEGHKIHWVSSTTICKSKEDGGVGFRNTEAFEQAMLAKQFWRLLKNPSSLVACFLQTIYFPIVISSEQSSVIIQALHGGALSGSEM